MGLTGCLGGETESMEDVLKMPCTALGRARHLDMIITIYASDYLQ